MSRSADYQALGQILEPAFSDRTVLAALESGELPGGTNGASMPAFQELEALLEELEARSQAGTPPPMPSAKSPKTPLGIAALSEDVADVLEAEALIEVEDDDLGGAAEIQMESGQPPALVTTAPPPLERGKRRKLTTALLDRRVAMLLYDDVLWLLAINDGEGALISLERLLVIATPSGDLKEFVDLNEAKLLSLYEGYMGPFDKLVQRVPPHEGMGAMPTAYTGNEKIGNVLNLVDGTSSISKIVAGSPYSQLETCCILNQLRRAALVLI
jgi:hypothetical protein